MRNYMIIVLLLMLHVKALAAPLSLQSQQRIEQMKSELKLAIADLEKVAIEKQIPLGALNHSYVSPPLDNAILRVIFEPQNSSLEILSINPQSPAFGSLKAGDSITHINDIPVSTQSAKSIHDLLSNLMSIDEIRLRLKDNTAPVIVDMAKGARLLPAYRLRIKVSKLAGEIGGTGRKNAPNHFQALAPQFSSIRKTIEMALRDIAYFELANTELSEFPTFNLEEQALTNISYSITTGSEVTKRHQIPKVASFPNGKTPPLTSCDSAECKKIANSYRHLLRFEESGILSRLRTAQFAAAGYGTVKLPSAPMLAYIGRISGASSAHAKAGELYLLQRNEPISASVVLLRAVRSEHPDPKAFKLLQLLYSQPQYKAKNSALASQYAESFEHYPQDVPEGNPEEFFLNELSHFPLR
ncbi:hypothetical protein [Glaciecola sp. 1036]|uniref:hypothetical protein n=1 Tax=Alteromonadaceae TaxID=72275 RepID=UPI003D0531AF